MLKILLNVLPVTAGFAAGIAGGYLLTFYLNRRKKRAKQKHRYIAGSKPYDFHF
ncbi:hypothetical protein [uncultured Victivallis sp.]|uniref:hypothetical protein n=1 Tax=uncultured Victivallis sp. TaxID=354118 RepID=UPI0025F190D7|nr:hypothetical protein [uncultured Victivallis sp.]